MSSYISPKVEVRESKISKKGIFAVDKILKGEEADSLYENGNDYMLQIDNNLFSVSVKNGELDDANFINHSCNPNCGISGSLKIIAMRDIEPEEEITFDYVMSESSDYEMECKCSSSNCRKVITGNDWKNEELQKRYNGFFSDYLQHMIDEI